MENKINQLIIKDISEIIITFNDNGIITSANDFAVECYNESLIGKKIYNIIDVPRHKSYINYKHNHIFTDNNGIFHQLEVKIFSVLDDKSRVHNILLGKDINQQEEYKNQLEELILQKESYIKDVHHKIKNNLQAIISILEMQLSEAASELDITKPCEVRYFNKMEMFINDIQRRIIAISLVHSLLNKNNFDAHTSNINFSIYIYNLIEQISGLFSMQNKTVKCEFEGKDYLIMSERAIPAGLIINEILSNFYKFCIDNQCISNPCIKIKMTHVNKKRDTLKLKIEIIHSSKQYQLPQESMNLMTGLLKQIKATLSINSNRNKSIFTITLN